MSSGSFYWTRWMMDMCPLLNMYSNPDMSSENFHWIQAMSFIYSTYYVLEYLDNWFQKKKEYLDNL